MLADPALSEGVYHGYTSIYALVRRKARGPRCGLTVNAAITL